MIITSEYISYNPPIDSINDIVKTTIEEHSEKYGHDDFYKITKKSNIEIVDLINNKTENITVAARNVMHKAQRTIVASKENYKINRINRMSIVLESVIKKHVINTYFKMQTPMMWRKFFKHIAEKRDYVYK